MDESERDELDRQDRTARSDFRGYVLKELRDMNTKISRLTELLNGNGKPGMKSTMERLDRNDERRTKIEWLLMSAVLLWLVNQIVAKLTGH